jgi:DNA-directed RNA polymerase subunit K/omega
MSGKTNKAEVKSIEENKVIIDNPDQRITSDILNKYEVSAIISKRAEEISKGAPFEEDLLDQVTDKKFMAQQLAELELKYGLIDYIKKYF